MLGPEFTSNAQPQALPPAPRLPPGTGTLPGGATLTLAERWITVALDQQVRVYPAALRADAGGAPPLLHGRLRELERRRLHQRGAGRDVESLREYQADDVLRDVSWTATARRGRVIPRRYTKGRSQQV